eukprot:6835463-Lingulodinium_polyedra.AAC.1
MPRELRAKVEPQQQQAGEAKRFAGPTLDWKKDYGSGSAISPTSLLWGYVGRCFGRGRFVD